jgi:hypothetical protein
MSTAGITVLVCGGRDYNDAETVGAWLGGVQKQRGGIKRIIEGGAQGADRLARLYGEWQRIQVVTFAADWRTHGRAAGPMRNARMLDEGKPDLVLAFPGGVGTADMVRRAREAGIEVVEASPTTYAAGRSA